MCTFLSPRSLSLPPVKVSAFFLLFHSAVFRSHRAFALGAYKFDAVVIVRAAVAAAQTFRAEWKIIGSARSCPWREKREALRRSPAMALNSKRRESLPGTLGCFSPARRLFLPWNLLRHDGKLCVITFCARLLILLYKTPARLCVYYQRSRVINGPGGVEKV